MIALAHDTINIEGDRYAGGVALDGEYQIEWPDFLDYPLGKGAARVQVTPFDVTNDNCKTCEEAGQLDLQDDTFDEPLEEGSENEINVYDNDSICCSPVTASIVTFNTTFVDSATIDEDTGEVTITIKNPSPNGSGILLATYRVTCPDGSYDEANIYGTIEGGSVETCEPPSAVVPSMTGLDSATIEWTASPSSPPSYGWQLFACDDLGTILLQGTRNTNNVPLVGLTPATCYRLVVWSICDVDNISETTYGEFTTDADLPGCGKFQLTNNLYPNNPSGQASYMDCGGSIVNILVTNIRENVCMMVDSDNNPVYFVSQAGSQIIYLNTGSCNAEGMLTVQAPDRVNVITISGITNDVVMPVTNGTKMGTWQAFNTGTINVGLSTSESGMIRVYYHGILQASQAYSGSGVYAVSGLSTPSDATPIKIEVT